MHRHTGNEQQIDARMQTHTHTHTHKDEFEITHTHTYIVVDMCKRRSNHADMTWLRTFTTSPVSTIL